MRLTIFEKYKINHDFKTMCVFFSFKKESRFFPPTLEHVRKHDFKNHFGYL